MRYKIKGTGGIDRKDMDVRTDERIYKRYGPRSANGTALWITVLDNGRGHAQLTDSQR